MNIRYFQNDCKCCLMAFWISLKSQLVYFFGRLKFCDLDASASVALDLSSCSKIFQMSVVSEPNVGWHHFLKISTALTTQYHLSNLWLIVGMLVIISKKKLKSLHKI